MPAQERSDRRRFLRQVGCGAAAITVAGTMGRAATAQPTAPGEDAVTERPNILLILADDLGWADVGFHGSQIQTPNLDRLAAEGVELHQHYVCPMCTPTRAALLSGRYPGRFGNRALSPSNERVFPFGIETLASALKSVGYRTGLFGKWHLGSLPEWGPNHFGFDSSYGSLAGGVEPYHHKYKKGPYTDTWHRNETLVDEEGHVTDLIGREAVGWLSQQPEPWFCYVPWTAVHIPVLAPQQYLDMYAGQRYCDNEAEDESFRRYAAYATQMDDWIGRLVAMVEERGRRDNTVVIFTSDNGAPASWRYAGLYPHPHPDCPVLGSNLPLRGRKGQVYEGGIRTPTLVTWPGQLAPGRRAAPAHAVDWMPTLTRLAGYRPERDLRWDGRDLWPVIAGEEESPEPRTLYWPFVGGTWAVRHGDWKLLCTGEGKPVELYDLAADPYEKQSLAPEMPDKVAELQERLAEVRKADVEDRPPDAGN